ncbi:MAG: MarR family transcriptional regulator [Nocardioidaceae bacterium]
MPDHHTLEETERAMKEHVGALPLNFAAANALSNLFRAAHAVRTELTNRVLREHDMTWTGFVVLWVVWIWDGGEARHVAESADISKATLTGVVKTLEGRGLLVREGDAADRRLVRLRLTPDGEELMQQIYPEFNAVESEIVSQLSDSKVRAFTRTLRDVVKAVEHVTPAGS